MRSITEAVTGKVKEQSGCDIGAAAFAAAVAAISLCMDSIAGAAREGNTDEADTFKRMAHEELNTVAAHFCGGPNGMTEGEFIKLCDLAYGILQSSIKVFKDTGAIDIFQEDTHHTETTH